MTLWPDKSTLACAAENSAYLKESLALFPALAQRAVKETPADILAALYGECPDAVGAHEQEMAMLRVLKRKAHLIIALADIAQVWGWAEVTRALSELADFAMRRLLIAAAREIDIYSGNPDNPCPGLFILAMGKYGAGELNYSSDIDFCVFYDPEYLKLARPERAERTLVKFVQLIIQGFERITAEGYIFRTDLRLRPDPRSNAVAVSTRTAERYYETIGQNWERAAMIKARICGGDMARGAEFIHNVLTPFIWRRSLDYAAIEDIHSIKRQIQARQDESGAGGIAPAGHHVKLGRGGIREIEFYAQTQQLILGGRNPHLRTPRTVQALEALAQGGYIDAQDGDVLQEAYALLRRFEHAAQMREDAQTHIVPEDQAARLQLARLAGYDNLADFDDALSRTLGEVHSRYVALFPGFESLALEEGTLSFTGVEADPQTLETLTKLGFSDGEGLWRDMAHWLGGRIKATRSERARELLTRLAPRLIKICAQTPEPDAAFRAFAGFIKRVNSGVSLFAMFLQEPTRLERVIELMIVSPRLLDTLSSRPAILDSMINPAFLQIDSAALAAPYAQVDSADFDFEDSLNFARRQLHEDHYRVAASVLSQELPIARAAEAFTALAEASLTALLPAAAKEAARRTGPLGGEYAVLALGKLGGRELSLASDLDIMLIYDAPPADQRNFTKLTQRLVSALSAVTAEGGLYEVDMALRPSGRSGPVAVSLEAFERYYADQAWTWEFMALTRARVVAASTPAFADVVTQAVTRHMLQSRGDLNTHKDIADMHARLAREKPARGPWDVKQSVGTQRDIEFIAQALYLARKDAYSGHEITATRAMLSRAAALGQIEEAVCTALINASVFFQNITQALALTHGGLAGQPSEAVLKAVARVAGFGGISEMTAEKKRHIENTAQILPKFIGG